MKKIRECAVSDSQSLPRIILTGDLNFPSVNWTHQTVSSCTTETRKQANVLLNFFQEFFLEQNVQDATRERNILDIFATNDHELVSHILVEDNHRKTSDHKTIIIRTNLVNESCLDHPINRQSNLEALNFHSDSIDWLGLRNDLSDVYWRDILEHGDVNYKYAKFLSHVIEACIKHFPKI